MLMIRIIHNTTHGDGDNNHDNDMDSKNACNDDNTKKSHDNHK